MKRTGIITAAVVVLAIVALFVFNKLFSKKEKVELICRGKKRSL